jgi:lipoyl(octanoyl) transferase
MNIQIKKSIKPVKYNFAIEFLEKRVSEVKINKSKELIWILEHDDIYTAGTSFSEKEILDKSINIVKTNRGGKITYHGPGQIICYFVIDLNKRKRDIRNLC